MPVSVMQDIAANVQPRQTLVVAGLQWQPLCLANPNRYAVIIACHGPSSIQISSASDEDIINTIPMTAGDVLNINIQDWGSFAYLQWNLAPDAGGPAAIVFEIILPRGG